MGNEEYVLHGLAYGKLMNSRPICRGRESGVQLGNELLVNVLERNVSDLVYEIMDPDAVIEQLKNEQNRAKKLISPYLSFGFMTSMLNLSSGNKAIIAVSAGYEEKADQADKNNSLDPTTATSIYAIITKSAPCQFGKSREIHEELADEAMRIINLFDLSIFEHDKHLEFDYRISGALMRENHPLSNYFLNSWPDANRRDGVKFPDNGCQDETIDNVTEDILKNTGFKKIDATCLRASPQDACSARFFQVAGQPLRTFGFSDIIDEKVLADELRSTVENLLVFGNFEIFSERETVLDSLWKNS
ncbi:MAG: hypothetical protein Q8O89_05790 [Nanoarchaeota archaeon]|nr:hypothetical protein [Nanoarchaeota archaeon]